MADVEVPVVDTPMTNVEPIEQQRLGTCFIFSTKNNTIVMVTDITGRETFAKFSGGMKVKSKKDEGSPYAAIQAAQDAADKAMKCGITVCNIKVRARGGIKRKNLGPGAQAALRTFIASGIKVGRIECVTPIPTDGCRKKGGHRGRRV
ncbi:small subunit ribosomal protein S14e [Pancytospora epiphaga]|nr:small subunit ribosomal protein S14e [Pancytospora epiphaga]